MSAPPPLSLRPLCPPIPSLSSTDCAFCARPFVRMGKTISELESLDNKKQRKLIHRLRAPILLRLKDEYVYCLLFNPNQAPEINDFYSILFYSLYKVLSPAPEPPLPKILLRLPSFPWNRIWPRVSQFRFKKCFASKRNLAKQKRFRFVSLQFRETTNQKFRFVSLCFAS